MSELEIAVGDRVRVQFHPPSPMRSFCEGVVRRVDVVTPEGRSFVVEVTHEVILDREHRIRPGFQDFVMYECRDDFLGRIEILSTAAQVVASEPAPVPVAAQLPGEPQDERIPEPEADGARFQVEVERQEVRRRSGLIAALFGRQK
jgi:hypothetical protein